VNTNPTKQTMTDYNQIVS